MQELKNIECSEQIASDIVPPMEEGLSDDEIIARVLGGDTESFGLLFDRYQRYVAKVVSRYVPSQDVEEVALESFTRAFQKLDKFSSQGAFRHWLASLSTRIAYDHLRKISRNKSLPMSSLQNEHKEWMDSTMAGAAIEKFGREQEKQLAEEVLEHALSQLGPEDRMVVSLIHLEERSCKETAQILGWSEVNVRVRSLRAKTKMKKAIELARSEDS